MSYQQDIFSLIARFSGQENMLSVPRVFCEVTGSLEAGMLLSQLLYWSDKGYDPEGWFYKSYIEWSDHLFLTEYQVRKFSKQFEEAGFLEVKLKKVNGSPTLHYRIKRGEFSEWILQNLGIETAKFPNRNRKISESNNKETEITTEITTETTTLAIIPPPPILVTPNGGGGAEHSANSLNANGLNGNHNGHHAVTNDSGALRSPQSLSARSLAIEWAADFAAGWASLEADLAGWTDGQIRCLLTWLYVWAIEADSQDRSLEPAARYDAGQRLATNYANVYAGSTNRIGLIKSKVAAGVAVSLTEADTAALDGLIEQRSFA